MSCPQCDTQPLHGAFIRWKNANVEIVACREHWREIQAVLSPAQAHHRDPTDEDIDRLMGGRPHDRL